MIGWLLFGIIAYLVGTVTGCIIGYAWKELSNNE